MPIPHFKNKKTSPWLDYKSVRGIKTKENKKKVKLIKKLIILAFVLLAFAFIAVSIYVIIISRNLPNPNQLINREVAQTTKIYDRSGKTVLYEISGDEKRTLVQLKNVPNYVKEATIAIEDKNFYQHGAFSVWAMFRTAITDVLFHRSAGGSTLTQQFVKNAILTSRKTISRKIKELVIAYRLEKKFSKDEILQMYLNEIPYGSNAYGVEAASQKYFGKDVKDISLAESAVLAAMIQTPSRYSPYGPNKELLLGRKNYVLNLMAEQGYITKEKRDAAKKEKIKFKGPQTNIIAPHFVMYIKNILTLKYGQKMVEQGGLKIYTTLDLYKQKIAEDVIKKRTKNYIKRYKANNAALVSIDPKTGQILAMVGSRDYFDNSIDGQVNVATRLRQPGSSMKPIVYAALFEKGYTPNTLLYDTVTNFSTNPNKSYEPHNYDNKEHGPVSIRKALAGSLNIPAVKAIYLAGVNNVLDLADNLGYTTLHPRNRFGLSLVLGGGEVKLLEHTNAYSAFARDGQLSPLVGILKVEDKNGRIIEEYKTNSKKVLSSQVARMINSILSDNEARSYVFGHHNYLNLGKRPVGAKTGTTNDYRDAWTVGYTPSLVTGVWVGNTDNKAMKRGAEGSTMAAPIWHDYMAKVLGNTPIEKFKAPDDYITGKAILDGKIPSEKEMVDISNGKKASSSTPPELIAIKTVPAIHNILYFINKNNPRESGNSKNDPQFSAWENSVQNWYKTSASSSDFKNLLASSSDFTLDNPPLNSSDAPQIKIISPQANQTISDSNLKVGLNIIALRNLKRTEYYINNNLWFTQWGIPSPFTKKIDFLNNGYHTLKVRACNENEDCNETQINFNLLIPNNPIKFKDNFIKITNPRSGIAVNSIDFPLPINIQVNKIKQSAKIDLFIKNKKGTIVTLKTITNNISNGINYIWRVPPPSGVYSLYAVLYNWDGSSVKSNEVKMVITK